MLKIKSEIDLKELEKYGFELDEYNKYTLSITIVIPCYCYSCENGNTNHSKKEKIKGLYVEKNRIIHRVGYGGQHSFYRNSFNRKEYDTLYDLIKDGLVEKVEE